VTEKRRPAGNARGRRRRRPIESPSGVEGRILELCRDLAVQTKRMRDLQQQAEELQLVIHEWVDQLDPEAAEFVRE
jgi:hypothetical protein